VVDKVLRRVNEIGQLRARAILVSVLNVLFGGIQLGEQTILLRSVKLLICIDACPQVVNGLQHGLHGYREAA
jgi:hypothetical protein